MKFSESCENFMFCNEKDKFYQVLKFSSFLQQVESRADLRTMGSSESKQPTPPSSTLVPAIPVPPPSTPPGEKPKCKACCACPETKKVRDVW